MWPQNIELPKFKMFKDHLAELVEKEDRSAFEAAKLEFHRMLCTGIKGSE